VPVAGSNWLGEKVSILGTFSRDSSFRIPFYRVHSWEMWSGLGRGGEVHHAEVATRHQAALIAHGTFGVVHLAAARPIPHCNL